jgi:hypothetical protein
VPSGCWNTAARMSWQTVSRSFLMRRFRTATKVRSDNHSTSILNGCPLPSVRAKLVNKCTRHEKTQTSCCGWQGGETEVSLYKHLFGAGGAKKRGTKLLCRGECQRLVLECDCLNMFRTFTVRPTPRHSVSMGRFRRGPHWEHGARCDREEFKHAGEPLPTVVRKQGTKSGVAARPANLESFSKFGDIRHCA